MEHDARVVHQHVQFWEIRLHAYREGGNLREIGGVALDGVKLRVFRLYLVEHCPAPPGHDDLVSEFGELERESKSDAGRAPGNEDGAACEIHHVPFVCLGSGMLHGIMIII